MKRVITIVADDDESLKAATAMLAQDIENNVRASIMPYHKAHGFSYYMESRHV